MRLRVDLGQAICTQGIEVVGYPEFVVLQGLVVARRLVLEADFVEVGVDKAQKSRSGSHVRLLEYLLQMGLLEVGVEL